MKLLTAIFLILLMVTSCGCPKNLVASQRVTDTLVVEKKVVLRDTVFHTKTAKVYIEVPVFKITEKPLFWYKDNSKVIVQKVRDTIRITAQCDSLELRAQLRDELTHEIQKTHVVDTKIIKVRYTPWPVKALAWIGGISLTVLLARLAIKKLLI